MTQFLDLDGILDRPLVLPYRGKQYAFRPVTGATEILIIAILRHELTRARLTKAAAAGEDTAEIEAELKVQRADVDALTEQGGADVDRLIMGDTLDEVLADRVPAKVVSHMLSTLTQWVMHEYDFEAAALVWNSPAATGNPEIEADLAPKGTTPQGRFVEGDPGPEWYEIYEHLDLIEMDFQEHLGLELRTAAAHAQRPMVQARIRTLLSMPPENLNPFGEAHFRHRTRIARAVLGN